MINTAGLFRCKAGMMKAGFPNRYDRPEYGRAQYGIRLLPWQGHIAAIIDVDRRRSTAPVPGQLLRKPAPI